MPLTEMIHLMVSAIYFVGVCKMSETRPFLNKDLKFFLGSIVSRQQLNQVNGRHFGGLRIPEFVSVELL